MNKTIDVSSAPGYEKGQNVFANGKPISGSNRERKNCLLWYEKNSSYLLSCVNINLSLYWYPEMDLSGTSFGASSRITEEILRVFFSRSKIYKGFIWCFVVRFDVFWSLLKSVQMFVQLFKSDINWVYQFECRRNL